MVYCRCKEGVIRNFKNGIDENDVGMPDFDH